MKIVFDTNVIVSATLWVNSVSLKLLKRLILNGVQIITSNEIIAEYYEVVMRDFLHSEEKTRNFLMKFISVAQSIEPKSKIDIVKADMDDNKVLECAIDSSSDYIVSYDNHLLSLKEYKGIKIIKPEELLEILK